MRGSDFTSTIQDSQLVSERSKVSILMVAHAPAFALTKDRCRIFDHFFVGRNAENDLTIEDGKISGSHFRISVQDEDFLIEDLGSTNGTYLDGERLTQKKKLHTNAVIRVGQSVLIYHGDAEECLTPPPSEQYGIIGQFHTAAILKKIAEAAFSREHLLITGPTGSGKELAAKAVHTIMSQRNPKMPFVTHNAACFTNDDEATSTLLGIANRAFTSVNPRPGLIEQAEGGILFLDEIHNYTTRVQRSLLRIIEDKKFSRIGETVTRTADVRFLFASNEPGAIAPDLLGRLRQSPVMPSLTERRADIPGIFNHVLKKKLESYGISEMSVEPFLKGQHYELLCLNGFEKYNVRGIKHFADIIAAGIGTGTSLEEAIGTAFSTEFPNKVSLGTDKGDSRPSPPVRKAPLLESQDKKTRSKYERNKDLIIEQFKDHDGNISSTTRALERRGLKCSRRHVWSYLKQWGVI
jgi:DNA-binding NtrC family response regulator